MAFQTGGPSNHSFWTPRANLHIYDIVGPLNDVKSFLLKFVYSCKSNWKGWGVELELLRPFLKTLLGHSLITVQVN